MTGDFLMVLLGKVGQSVENEAEGVSVFFKGRGP